MTRRRRGEAGQASVELVAVLPLLVVVALAAGQLLAAGAAQALAGHAAGAGAVALLQGADPVEAARDALPGWSRKRMDVQVRAGRVSVALRPPVVFAALADPLTARAPRARGPCRPVAIDRRRRR